MIPRAEANLSKNRIPTDEISFHPNSFGDSAGRLFYWDGQLYRGIRTEWAPFLEGLFREGVIQNLLNRGLLIDTELTPLAVDGYGPVVRHHTIPFPSYTHEWCAAMLKDAALTILEVSIELGHSQLGLKDAHPWNVLFDSSRPCYVDLTSIAPVSNISYAGWREEFCQYTLYPLLLMTMGQERIARWLLWDYDGVRESDFLLLTQGAARPAAIRPPILPTLVEAVWQHTPQPLRRFLKTGLAPARPVASKRFSHAAAYMDFLKKTRREVAGIHTPSEEMRRQDPVEPSIQASGEEKRETLRQILSEKRPETVLDVGCHTGWLSILAAVMGSKVISFEADSNDAERLYQTARQEELPILPLVMDFARPTPARGLGDHCYVAASERFQCEMVLAVSSLQHLVFQKRLNFDQIAGGLVDFSRRWVVVEFTPYEGQETQEEMLERAPWYTLDNFTNALERRFRDVRMLSSSSESGLIFLCEK